MDSTGRKVNSNRLVAVWAALWFAKGTRVVATAHIGLAKDNKWGRGESPSKPCYAVAA